MTSVVTISASYGAGGSVVGPQLAERLGVPFLDRAIPVAVARQLEVSVDEAISQEEVPRDTFTRWMSHFAPAVQLFGGAPIPHEVTAMHDEQFRVATEKVLREYAENGAVILGRAGAVVLHEWPGALHVRLDGAPERRLEQAMRILEVDADEARRELKTSDVAREGYVKHWYGVDARDPSCYDVVLDSTRLPLDACVELLARAVAARAG
jgi:cytidylate kinase